MGIGQAFYPLSQSRSPEQVSRPAGKLLIMGDEARVRRTLHAALYSLGFDIAEAGSGAEALALCRIASFDAVLVDTNMSGNDGIQTCAELRRLLPRGAILVLSVNDDRERRAETLEAGADDCMTKPFHMPELTARIRATLRRALTAAAQPEEVVAIGDVSLDPARRLVLKAGRRIHLTPREYDLLGALMADPGIPVACGRLLHVLGGDKYSTRVHCLRTLVRQLRRKIEDDPGAPRYVLTESHIGYRFADPEYWLKKEIPLCSCGPGHGFEKLNGG